MAQSLKLFQRNHGFLKERANGGSPQGANMPKTAQDTAEVSRQRAHIRTFAALRFKHRVVPIGDVDELQPSNFDRPRCKIHLFAISGEIIGPLAFDLDGGISRVHLLYKPSVIWQAVAYGF